MTKEFCAIALVILIGAASADELIGCGDKFLSAARGTRFQQAPRGRQETILIFANPDSDVPAATARLSVESALRAAGYRPTTVTTAPEFERELGLNKWDLVLTGLTDAEIVSRHRQTENSILPVVLKATKAQMQDAQTRYPVVLTKAPNAQGFIRAISQALASRAGVKSD
jgi:hypothetical protein